MTANSDQVLHVVARHFPVYRTDDLNYFQGILNDVIEYYESLGSLPAHEKACLKARLAVAIFKSAEAGERDYTRLRRSLIEAVSAVPSSDLGSRLQA
jgi:hypothetical protein